MGNTRRFKVGLNKDISIEREREKGNIAIVLFSEMFTDLVATF